MEADIDFFARTQRAHEWKSPQYRFTRQQHEAWKALVCEARRRADSDNRLGDSNNDDNDDSNNDDNDSNNDDNNDDDEAHPKLTPIQKACLGFCVALLNQTIRRNEYDCALVCALAVLGVKEDGWKGPELYPPVLSSVIKVARFMVVQQALELSDPFSDDDDFDDDSAYGGLDGGSSPSSRQPKGCLEFVEKMVDGSWCAAATA
jgi:hypothetical protein